MVLFVAIEREAGELWRDNIIRLVASVRPTFISFGLSPEEADHRAKEVQAELRGGEVQQYIKVRQTTNLRLSLLTFHLRLIANSFTLDSSTSHGP